ncbi:MAG: ribulose-phosphate 3-epimerase [Pirellulales bacterium]|nr:ribulose-phosphate 3-epimerase [Pirellulales bacterium]
MSSPANWEQLCASVPAVLPSMLQCDFTDLRGEVARLEAAGITGLHLDVMDGHFVPNLTYGPPLVEALRRTTQLPLDAHLMISDPARYLSAFADAGADGLTFHIEAVPDPRPVLGQIRRLGLKAGLAINPPTPLVAIEPYLAECDLVLVMSVMPGFGGQKFDAVALEKLTRLRQIRPPGLLLEVDGGVNAETIAACGQAGADLLVVGSAIFAAADYAERIELLRQRLRGPIA